MNKFEALMQFLTEQVQGFSQLVLVDANFDVFRRAWCIAEIVEATSAGIPSRLSLGSPDVLDKHYEGLVALDVRNCRASRAEDKDMILARIGDTHAFNMTLQWAIFGTQGLLGKWIDGQQRAAIIGRFLGRARNIQQSLGP